MEFLTETTGESSFKELIVKSKYHPVHSGSMDVEKTELDANKSKETHTEASLNDDPSETAIERTLISMMACKYPKIYFLCRVIFHNFSSKIATHRHCNLQTE